MHCRLIGPDRSAGRRRAGDEDAAFKWASRPASHQSQVFTCADEALCKHPPSYLPAPRTQHSPHARTRLFITRREAADSQKHANTPLALYEATSGYLPHVSLEGRRRVAGVETATVIQPAWFRSTGRAGVKMDWIAPGDG